MRPSARQPDASALALLPGATFADAFSVDVDDAELDANTAATRALSETPPWIAGLLTLRNALVRPFGLVGTDETGKLATDRIGFFPCLSRAPERIVLGLNDKHLDFRIAVDVQTLNPGSKRVIATTVVKPHNVLGRTYLTSIMPFHKLIVPIMLARVRRR